VVAARSRQDVNHHAARRVDTRFCDEPHHPPSRPGWACTCASTILRFRRFTDPRLMKDKCRRGAGAFASQSLTRCATPVWDPRAKPDGRVSKRLPRLRSLSEWPPQRN
jgi:hypothetical protein